MKNFRMIVFRKSEEPPPKPKTGLGGIFSRMKSGEIGGSSAPAPASASAPAPVGGPSPFRTRVVPQGLSSPPRQLVPEPVPVASEPVVQDVSKPPSPFRSRNAPSIVQPVEGQETRGPFVPRPRDRAIHHVLLSQFRDLAPEVQESVRAIQDELLAHHAKHTEGLLEQGLPIPSSSSKEYTEGLTASSGTSYAADLLDAMRAHHGQMRGAIGESQLHRDFKHPNEFHASDEATASARSIIEENLAKKASEGLTDANGNSLMSVEFPLFTAARNRAMQNG